MCSNKNSYLYWGWVRVEGTRGCGSWKSKVCMSWEKRIREKKGVLSLEIIGIIVLTNLFVWFVYNLTAKEWWIPKNHGFCKIEACWLYLIQTNDYEGKVQRWVLRWATRNRVCYIRRNLLLALLHSGWQKNDWKLLRSCEPYSR